MGLATIRAGQHSVANCGGLGARNCHDHALPAHRGESLWPDSASGGDVPALARFPNNSESHLARAPCLHS